MNDKQKWFIVIAVGCISSLVMAIMFERVGDVFDVEMVYIDAGAASNWTGCLLFGYFAHQLLDSFFSKISN